MWGIKDAMSGRGDMESLKRPMAASGDQLRIPVVFHQRHDLSGFIWLPRHHNRSRSPKVIWWLWLFRGSRLSAWVSAHLKDNAHFAFNKFSKVCLERSRGLEKLYFPQRPIRSILYCPVKTCHVLKIAMSLLGTSQRLSTYYLLMLREET